MRKILAFFFLTTSTLFAQSKLTFEYKNCIGKTFTNNNKIEELKTFNYEQGNIIGSTNEGPFYSTIDVYRKGTTALILLSKKISSNPDVYSIINVLKIEKVAKNQEIRTLGCSRKNALPDETIIAVINAETKNKIPIIKQAFVLNDIRFKPISYKGIKCLNYGMD